MSMVSVLAQPRVSLTITPLRIVSGDAIDDADISDSETDANSDAEAQEPAAATQPRTKKTPTVAMAKPASADATGAAAPGEATKPPAATAAELPPQPLVRNACSCMRLYPCAIYVRSQPLIMHCRACWQGRATIRRLDGISSETPLRSSPELNSAELLFIPNETSVEVLRFVDGAGVSFAHVVTDEQQQGYVKKAVVYMNSRRRSQRPV